MRVSRWIIAGACTGLLLSGGTWLAREFAPGPPDSPPPTASAEAQREQANRHNAESERRLSTLPKDGDRIFEAPRGQPVQPYIRLDAQGPGTDTPGVDRDKDGVWDDAQARLAPYVKQVPVTARQVVSVTKLLQRALITAQLPGATSLNEKGEISPQGPARAEALALRAELKALGRCRLMRGPDLKALDTFDLAREALSTSPSRYHQMEVAWTMLSPPRDTNVNSVECPELNVMQNDQEQRWNDERLKQLKSLPVPTDPRDDGSPTGLPQPPSAPQLSGPPAAPQQP